MAKPLPLPVWVAGLASSSWSGWAIIVVFGEPGAWQPADDLIAHRKEGVETFVRLGEPVG